MKIAEAKIYKPRNAQGTASYKIFDQHYYEFKQVYNQKYIWKYGFFRPIIDETVKRFLKCGILKYGFARIKCTNCNKEYLLPYSCKSRICPSCMTKSMLQFQDFILEKIIQKVPHRHIVFCLPKILRSGFIRNREFLNDLSGIVWEATKEFMQRTLHVEGVPGGIQVIQTHGNLLNPNPHIHSITSDGLFTENRTFYCMPHCSEKAKDYLLKLFEKKVCDFVPEHKIAGEKNIRRILGQKHSGFSYI